MSQGRTRGFLGIRSEDKRQLSSPHDDRTIRERDLSRVSSVIKHHQETPNRLLATSILYSNFTTFFIIRLELYQEITPINHCV